MKEEAATDAEVRQFLLGRVDDEDRQRIESLFLTDPLVREKVLAAEQELIDDYLEDRLSQADRDSFLSLHGDTAAQRRKLRIAKSIKQWALDQQKTPVVTRESPISGRRSWLDWMRAKPLLVIPVGVAVTVVIVLALVWVSTRTSERDREYLALQRELAQLNAASGRRDVPGEMSLTLKPGSVRSVEAEAELKKHAGTSVAELRLLWMQQRDYPTFEAVLRRPGDDRSYSIPGLTSENDGGKVIRIQVPAPLLNRGQHQIELRGVSADGVRSAPEVYTFTVSE